MYGPFGNLFPYGDFHQLNLDWIIQVAKDFLDQYTHIQDIITSGETSIDEHTAAGLESLQNEKERLEGLLDAWYTEHSEDIATELTNAVSSFGTQAAEIAATVIATIPATYTDLSNLATALDTYTTKTSEISMIPFSAYKKRNGNISGTGTWNNINSNYQHILIKVNPGDEIVIARAQSADDGKYARYAILTSDAAPVNSADAPLATGYTTVVLVGEHDVEATVPENGNYLLIVTSYNTASYVPSTLKINNVDYIKPNQQKMIEGLFDILDTKIESETAERETEIGSINTALQGINKPFYQYALSNLICIGDSLTAGSYPDAVPGTSLPRGTQVQQNYPYYLGRILNTPCKNAGYPGYSAAEWWANRISVYDYTDYDAAIIWLGTNEGLTDTLETDVDPYDSYTDYANTNTGCYCKIIEKLKADNSDIFIALMTIYAGVGHTPADDNTVIRKIAQKYSLPVIDMSDLTRTNFPEFHSQDDPTHINKAGNIFVTDRVIKTLRTVFNEDPTLCEFGFTVREN